MTNDPTTAQRIEHAIRTYVKALNDADGDAIAACFCAGCRPLFPCTSQNIWGGRTWHVFCGQCSPGEGFPGQWIRCLSMSTVVPRRSNGRGLIQAGRAICGEWIGLSSSRRRSDFAKSALI